MTPGEVHNIRPRPEPKAAAPAVGVVFQIDLGNGAGMTLQTHYDQESTPAEIATLHDQLYDQAERIKARARIQAIAKEMEGLAKQAALTPPQIDRAEATYKAEVDKITQASDESAAADAQKQIDREVRGTYKPSQQEKQRQIGFASQLQKLKEERDTTLRNVEATATMLRARAEELYAEQVSLQAVVDAPYQRADR